MEYIVEYANYYLHKYWDRNYSLEFCYEDFFKSLVIAVCTAGVCWFLMRHAYGKETEKVYLPCTNTQTTTEGQDKSQENTPDPTPPAPPECPDVTDVDHAPVQNVVSDEHDIIFQIHRSARLSEDEAEARLCISLLMRVPHAVNMRQGRFDFTPFLCACWAGNLTLLRYMLENGANIDSRTTDGDSPLYLAVRAELVICHSPRFATLQLLLNHGADVNAQTLSGSTALHLASSVGHERLVKWLLEHGASPCKKNMKGQRPIDVAHNEGRNSVVKLLTTMASLSPLEESSDSSSSSSVVSRATSKFNMRSRPASVLKRQSLYGDCKRESLKTSGYSSRDSSRYNLSGGLDYQSEVMTGRRVMQSRDPRTTH